VEPSPLVLRSLNDLLHPPWMIDDDCGTLGVMIGRGINHLETFYAVHCLSTTNAIQLDSGSNECLRGRTPVANCLSYVTSINRSLSVNS
jgi:hypothetical protein